MINDWPSHYFDPSLGERPVLVEDAKRVSADIRHMYKLVDQLNKNVFTDESETLEEYFLKEKLNPELLPLMNSYLANDRGTDLKHSGTVDM